MKKANFDTLQNLPVPESWIENALAVPEREEQQAAAVPFWRRSRVIAAAASIVLVGALSILMVQLFGSVPPAVTKSYATEIVWATDENGETTASEVVIAEGGDQPADPPRTDGTVGGEAIAPTGPHSSESGTSPTESGRKDPTAKTSPTDGTKTDPSAVPSTEPAAVSTQTPQYATSAPTESASPRPTEAPRPTELPWVAPTEPAIQPPTVTPWFPDDPTEPPSYPRTITVYLNKRFSGLTASSTVYVSVYDSSGSRLGDDDPYAAQHIAVTNESGSFIAVSYTPGDLGLLPASGSYRYEVYDDRDRTLSTGTAKLSP